MNKKTFQLLIVLILGFFILLFFYLDFHHWMSFEKIEELQALAQNQFKENPLFFMFFFFISYMLMAALSLPGAAVMTLLCGALFGFFKGVIIASFASSIGATLCFILSRFLLKDWVEAKFGHKLKPIQDGFEKDGFMYLFSLRLIPAVPFFLVNILMALTRIKVFSFYWVSQLGMLIGTALFVNAGTQLATIESPKDILSPSLVASLVLLGVAPIIIKKIFYKFKGTP